MVACARCSTKRERSDMAFIGDLAYCHPGDSDGDTCYMKMDRNIGSIIDLLNRIQSERG